MQHFLNWLGDGIDAGSVIIGVDVYAFTQRQPARVERIGGYALAFNAGSVATCFALAALLALGALVRLRRVRTDQGI